MAQRLTAASSPLNTRLESGQTVEVVTSKSDKAGPSRDWLAFVASPRARSKIKAWFSRERKEEAVEAGKESIARAMRKQNLPLQRLMNHDSVLSVATSLGYPDISGLYAAVGDGHISAQNIVSKLVENLGGEMAPKKPSPRQSPRVLTFIQPLNSALRDKA